MTFNDAENFQSAYHLGQSAETENVDKDIHNAMYTYLTIDLGIEPSVAEQRAQSELSRDIPKSVIAMLLSRGVAISGQSILELGAGLGGMSEELLLNEAKITALEPGGAWARIARRRLERHGKPFYLINAFGEAIPVEKESFDVVISLQVLEHVKNPDLVLSEAYRVLRRGGYFYLACENYLSFEEPHYRIPWFPLLPKMIGGAYLRLLGRSPIFLQEAITYATFPSVIGKCRKLGFLRPRDMEIQRNIKSKNNLTWRIMKLLATFSGNRGPIFLDDARNMFKPGIYELFKKPSF